MPVDLLLPPGEVPALKMPSRVKLAMAFGVGAGANLYDKSRFRSHGAITTATWVAGLHGFALNFVDTNPDTVTIPAANCTQLDFTNQDFSFIARAYFDLAAGLPTICARQAAGSGWRFERRGGGVMRVTTVGTTGAIGTDTVGLAVGVGVWYTLGFSMIYPRVYIYVNGIDVSSILGAHPDIITSPGNFCLGTFSDGTSQSFDGRMEFARVFGGIGLAASEHLAWHRALA